MTRHLCVCSYKDYGPKHGILLMKNYFFELMHKSYKVQIIVVYCLELFVMSPFLSKETAHICGL